MDSVLIKYLIIKMILGKDCTASFEEINNLEKFLVDKGYKVKIESQNNYIENKGDFFEANYNLNREVYDINGINMKEFELLKTFISKLKEKRIIANEELLNRCKEIYVYLVEMLTCYYNNPNISLEELESVDKVPDEVKTIFNELSFRSAYLLEKDNELLLSNDSLENNSRLAYKTYFNNIFITNNIKKLIYKYTNGNYLKYLVDFGNGTYYGIPSFKQDMLVVHNEEETTDPIYIPRIIVGDSNMLQFQSKKIEEVRKNIKRLML